MATNEILPFAQGVGANVQDQAAYTAEPLRSSGNVAGIARSNVNNKAIRQATLMASALAQYIADRQANDLVDTASASDIATWLSDAILADIGDADLPIGYFSGFTVANDGGAPNNTISVGVGAARSSDNTVNIFLTSSLRGILQSAGAWAAGDNQKKLDTGAKANSTAYHVFSIRKTSDGAGDILFSLSATAPTLPVGYAGFRRIGRIVTDDSGNIRAFKDRGNGYFDWVAPIIEATVASTASGSTTLTLTGLGGVPVRARVQCFISADAGAIKITATDVPNNATGAATSDWTGGHVVQAGGGSSNETGASEFEVSTDASSQTLLRYYSGTGNAGYRVITFGYQEIR